MDKSKLFRQLLLPRQMVPDMATRSYLCDPFQEFSMPHQQVRVEVCASAIPSLLRAYQPWCDYNGDMQKLRFPNCEHHHGFVESRDQ
jgi:hypothetical protein